MKKQYQELLSRSEGLGFVQALECLEQAAGLFTEDGRWAFCLLRRIEEDYVFSMEEEKQLKDLVYQAVDGQGGTILERLKENSHVYGRFAYQMGIAYWYFMMDRSKKRCVFLVSGGNPFSERKGRRKTGGVVFVCFNPCRYRIVL